MLHSTKMRFRKRFETPWYLYTWDGNEDHILEELKEVWMLPS